MYKKTVKSRFVRPWPTRALQVPGPPRPTRAHQGAPGTQGPSGPTKIHKGPPGLTRAHQGTKAHQGTPAHIPKQSLAPSQPAPSQSRSSDDTPVSQRPLLQLWNDDEGNRWDVNATLENDEEVQNNHEQDAVPLNDICEEAFHSSCALIDCDDIDNAFPQPKELKHCG